MCLNAIKNSGLNGGVREWMSIIGGSCEKDLRIAGREFHT